VSGDWKDLFERSLEKIDGLEKKCAELKALAYVPGQRRCAKCGFVLVTATIHYPSGGMSADLKPKDCANGCGPMWLVTERQAANESIDREDKLRALIKQAEWGREGQCIWCLAIEGQQHSDDCPAFTSHGGVR
jgi:hypothetical protein